MSLTQGLNGRLRTFLQRFQQLHRRLMMWQTARPFSVRNAGKIRTFSAMIQSLLFAAFPHNAAAAKMRVFGASAAGAERGFFHDFISPLMRLNPSSLPEPSDQLLRGLPILTGAPQITALAFNSAGRHFRNIHHASLLSFTRYVPNSLSFT